MIRRSSIAIIPLLLILCFHVWADESSQSWMDEIAIEQDPQRRVDLHVDLGKSLLGEPEAAMAAVEDGLALARKIGYQSGEADLLNLRGVICWQSGDLPGSIEYYRQSLKLRDKEKEGAAIADGLGNIGLANLMLGQFDAAITDLNETVSIRERLGLENKMAGSLVNLGYGYFYKGDYESAIRCNLKALDTYERLKDDDGMATALNSVGSLFLEIKEYDKAEMYFRRALECAERLNRDSIPIYGNLGHIDLHKGDYEAAIEKFTYVLEHEHEIVDPSLAVEANNALGNAYQKLGEPEKAFRHYKQAIDVEADPSIRNLRLSGLLSLATLSYELFNEAEVGDRELLDSGVVYAKEALEISTDLDLKKQQMEACFELSRLSEALGREGESLGYFKQFKALNDAILDSEKHQQIAELETQYQVANKNREIETLETSRKIQELKINEQAESMKAQRRLIMIVLVVLLMFLISGFLIWKWNQARQRNAQNELLIKNLRTEQKLFRSQMNPHFIYNSLNSIQSFISSNESYLAEKYLAKFAKLMRGILENSMKETVPFEKEMEVIEGYLELEKVRFAGRFDFEIRLDEDFEAEFISIPPMLIQPFLENSILHGFANVKGDGKLVVSFRDADEYLICEIDDNGIGREAAAKMPKKKGKTSLATQITHDRLSAISQQAGRPATMEIIDKFDESDPKRSTGTRVVLKIPLLD